MSLSFGSGSCHSNNSNSNNATHQTSSKTFASLGRKLYNNNNNDNSAWQPFWLTVSSSLVSLHFYFFCLTVRLSVRLSVYAWITFVTFAEGKLILKSFLENRLRLCFVKNWKTEIQQKCSKLRCYSYSKWGSEGKGRGGRANKGGWQQQLPCSTCLTFSQVDFWLCG